MSANPDRAKKVEVVIPDDASIDGCLNVLGALLPNGLLFWNLTA